MRYQAMETLQKEYSITRLCQVLQVSPSGYYAWKNREKSQRHQEDEKLSEQIHQVYQQSRQTYGSPRIHAHLQKQGIGCGHKRVIRLRQKQHLCAQRIHHRCQTTDSRHDHPIAPNVLQRDFSADKPNAKWVADITGVWTSQGWFYVALVLDVFSRMVVGWAMDAVRDDD
jgi:putative transposase